MEWILGILLVVSVVLNLVQHLRDTRIGIVRWRDQTGVHRMFAEDRPQDGKASNSEAEALGMVLRPRPNIYYYRDPTVVELAIHQRVWEIKEEVER